MTGAEASAPGVAQPANGETQQLDIAQLNQALAEAQQQAAGHKDQYLRTVAEMENVRKRAQRDVENASRYGLEKFAIELLPVLDSLQGAVSSVAARADVKSLITGQEATLKLLVKAFERLNIARSTRPASSSIRLGTRRSWRRIPRPPNRIRCSRWYSRALSLAAGCCAPRE